MTYTVTQIHYSYPCLSGVIDIHGHYAIHSITLMERNIYSEHELRFIENLHIINEEIQIGTRVIINNIFLNGFTFSENLKIIPCEVYESHSAKDNIKSIKNRDHGIPFTGLPSNHIIVNTSPDLADLFIDNVDSILCKKSSTK